VASAAAEEVSNIRRGTVFDDRRHNLTPTKIELPAFWNHSGRAPVRGTAMRPMPNAYLE